MNSGSSDSNYSDDEIARRRDEALLRALSTPPKRHSEMKLGKRKAKADAKASPPKKRRRPTRGKSRPNDEDRAT